MKTGIFGGTFNPVHYGHLINAELIRVAFDLDRVLFVPAKKPVHKELAGNVDGEHRFEMLGASVRGNPGFEVSRLELDREGPSYTITTLEDLRTQMPGDELFLIIGSDSLRDMPEWKRPRDIISIAELIVMNREGSSPTAQPFAIDRERIHYAGNPVIGISSSFIRRRLEDGLSVRYLLPDVVIHYIEEKRLYVQ